MTVSIQENDINYHRIEQAILFIESNFKRQPDLDEIAAHVNMSPFHFQRIFTEWAGISPKRFLQFLTIDFLKAKLTESRSLADAADSAGLSSQSRIYDLFTTLEAVTPDEYKRRGEGIQITYGFHETPFGICFIGITERGVCWLSFLSASLDREAAIEEMNLHWNRSKIMEDLASTRTVVERIFSKQPGSKLNLLVKGTNFQVKVWEALLKLPTGSLTTYQDIAATIGKRKALQAVGSAVGANHIAYLIPCHRVIRKDGILGHYRWSSPRKKGMIGWEMGILASEEKY